MLTVLMLSNLVMEIRVSSLCSALIQSPFIHGFHSHNLAALCCSYESWFMVSLSAFLYCWLLVEAPSDYLVGELSRHLPYHLPYTCPMAYFTYPLSYFIYTQPALSLTLPTLHLHYHLLHSPYTYPITYFTYPSPTLLSLLNLHYMSPPKSISSGRPM